MTHSEMTHWLPSPVGVELSHCPGEMAQDNLSRKLAARLSPPGRPTRDVEVWHCTRCNHTVVIESDGRGVRRIRNAFPAPTIPPLRVAGLN